MIQVTKLHQAILLLSLSGAFVPVRAQNISTICANSCGPRADMTAGEFQKCIQTCSTQGSKCIATKGSGTLFPKYYILGLVYAPPGCTKTATASCSSQSSVDYQNGSSMGTQVQTQSSFAKDLTVTASLSIGATQKFGASLSAGWTTTSSSSNSQTVTKATTLDIKESGNGDGIDHDQDVFLLLLNPAIALQQTSIFNGPGSCSPGAISWMFGINVAQLPNAALFKVSVGDLKNPASMPAATAAQLKALNFTNDDYQTILAQDPFAGGSTAIDSTRYVPTTTSFPYEPPDQSTECPGGVCSCIAVADTIKNEIATSIGNSFQSQYKVGVTESLTGIGTAAFNFGTSIASTFTWTSSSTDTDTTDSTQSATVSVQCPSVNYTGPAIMTVYWDKLYGSFMFVPTVLKPAQVQTMAQGTLTDASGKVVRHQPVTLSAAGKTFHTYTDSKGKYVFAAPPGFAAPATGQLSAMGTAKAISIGATLNVQAAAKQ
jgi:hypothetical protein